ncbi:MAG: hypothetical protein ACT4OP_10030, partial [Actinomycetota bacterium]
MPRLLVAVAFGLIAAACEAPAVGPEVTTTVPVTTTSLPADADQAIARFGECLVQHGVEVPAIQLDARGRPDLSVLESSTQLSSPRFRQAMVDCAGLLTTGG